MKEKKQKIPKEKKNFAERFSERMPLKKRLKVAMFAIIGLPLCIAITFTACVIFMGDSSFAYSDEVYDSIILAVKAYTKEGEGMGTLALQNSGIKEIHWDYVDGQSKLVCSIQNGFFNAKVTTDLTGNYVISGFHRNFNSRTEYMYFYWFCMGLMFLLGGIALWFLSIGLYHLIMRICYKPFTKKVPEDENPTPVTSKETTQPNAQEEAC